MRWVLLPASILAFMTSWFITTHPRITKEAAAYAAQPRLDPATAAPTPMETADRAVPATRASMESGLKGARLFTEAQEFIDAKRYDEAEKTLDLALTMSDDRSFKERCLSLRAVARRGQRNIKGALDDMRDACLLASGTACRDYEMALRAVTQPALGR